jgi:hypothetical protein
VFEKINKEDSQGGLLSSPKDFVFKGDENFPQSFL